MSFPACQRAEGERFGVVMVVVEEEELEVTRAEVVEELHRVLAVGVVTEQRDAGRPSESSGDLKSRN